ncbi:anti-sigma factor domain-containing protein [uncultured Brevibacillus sp.]|uniref:anti-sigma factor n=1 Tax=uncultured Brevibacillus sp. TaxID=169970 RepID=UPI0025975205|nr:anti-sigma factor [uncultured Brevibacillus sp.]
MDNCNHCSFTVDLISYAIGECTDIQKHILEEHIATCPLCRQEVIELREAWEMIPYQIPYQPQNVDVPADLKDQVMTAIFAPNEKTHKTWKQRVDTITAKWRPVSQRFIVVGLALALVGVIWNNLSLRQQLLASRESAQPAQVVQSYSLQATVNATASSKGNAWMYDQGEKRILVFYLQGLAATQGTEAYQVWLIRDGKRHSAGVFRVDSQGTGVLAYEMNDPSLPFEAIGITLEPDETGSQPRGKKVLGT